MTHKTAYFELNHLWTISDPLQRIRQPTLAQQMMLTSPIGQNYSLAEQENDSGNSQ